MTPSSFSKAKLRETYIELAKKYHPDRCEDLRICAARFKMVNEAHAILKDDSKRRAWNARYTGPYSPARAPRTRYYQNVYTPRWSEHFDPNWREHGEEKFRASLQENRYFLLKIVTGVVFFVAFLELVALFNASEKQTEELRKHSEEASAAHALASSNYGRGDGAQDRIDRFLEHRESMIKRKKGDFRYSNISKTGEDEHNLALPPAPAS